MQTELIDIHPHVISTDTARYPITPLGGKRSAWSETRPVDFPGLVRAMDAARIDKAAIVHSSTTYGYNSAYLADVIEGHHDRFTGVFSVDVNSSDAPAQIRYWVGRGLSGLRLFAAGSTVKANQGWIAEPVTYPAWQCCQDLNLPVAISLRLEGLPYLVDIMNRFPGVRIVIDHLLLSPIADGPPYRASAGLFDLARFPQVFLKLTTNNIRRSRDGLATPESFFAQLVEVFGSAHIAWGSNFPNEEGSLAAIVEEAKATLAFLPAEDFRNIFCRTALALYPSLRNGTS